jgi:molecular chaperone GrpE
MFDGGLWNWLLPAAVQKGGVRIGQGWVLLAAPAPSSFPISFSDRSIMSNESNEPGTVQPGETQSQAAAEPLTPAQIVDLQARAAQATESYERLLRVTADFENFKKRAARERDDARRSATESVISRFLPVIDNFDMALIAANQPNASVDSLKVGVGMIQGQLKNVFGESGVEEVQALGLQFDPSIHDAVSQQETLDLPEGQVVQVVRKGYKMRDRLLRPASVVVAKAPTATPAS